MRARLSEQGGECSRHNLSRCLRKAIDIVSVRLAAPSLANMAARCCFMAAPKVKAGRSSLDLMEGREAYAIETAAGVVKIAARSLAGVRWAVI